MEIIFIFKKQPKKAAFYPGNIWQQMATQRKRNIEIIRK
jgi:hypothetical protein